LSRLYTLINLFKEKKENIGEVPVLANTGVTPESVEDILKEVDKITWNQINQERENKLMQKISLLEKNLKKN